MVKTKRKFVIAALLAFIVMCGIFALAYTFEIKPVHAAESYNNYLPEGAPTADKESGTYTADSIEITLSSSVEDAKIYYTLDGTIPSRANGTEYSAPIELSYRSTKYVLRAVAEASGKYTDISVYTYKLAAVNLALGKTVTFHDYTHLWENLTGENTTTNDSEAAAAFLAKYAGALTNGFFGGYSVEIYNNSYYPYMVLDFGQAVKFNTVYASGIYTQGGAAFKVFELSVSDDNENWTEVYNKPNQELNCELTEADNPIPSGGVGYPLYRVAKATFEDVTAQYLKFKISQYEPNNGVDISEIQAKYELPAGEENEISPYIRPLQESDVTKEYTAYVGSDVNVLKQEILKEFGAYTFTGSDGKSLILDLAWNFPADFSTNEAKSFILNGRIKEVPQGYTNFYNIAFTATVNFVEFEPEYWQGNYNNLLYLYAPELEDNGNEGTAFEVKLNSPAADARVYYTLDGTVPTVESTLYEGPFELTLDKSVTVLKAVAYRDGKYSSVLTHIYDYSNVNLALGKTVTFHDYTHLWENLTGENTTTNDSEATAAFLETYGSALTNGHFGGYSVEIYNNSYYPYMVLDFGGEATFNTVYVSGLNSAHPSAGSPFKIFNLYTSNDKGEEKTWQTLYEHNGDFALNCDLAAEGYIDPPGGIGYVPAKVGKVAFENAVTARYLKFQISQYGPADGVDISEIQVYFKSDTQTVEQGTFVAGDVSYSVEAANGIATLNLIELLDSECGKRQKFVFDGNERETEVQWLFPENFDSSKAGSCIFYGVPSELPEDTVDLYKAAIAVTVNISAQPDALQKLIAEMEKVNTKSYSAASKVAFEQALNSAKAYLTANGNKFMYKEAVDGYIERLNSAYNALDAVAEESAKQALQTLLTECETILEGGDYAPGSLVALRVAVANANELLKRDTVYASECAAMAELLITAKGAVEEADKTALDNLVKECESITEDKYTAKSFDSFTVALTAAAAVNSAQSSMREDIDAALTALTAAKNALEEKGDTAALAAKIEYAESYVSWDYTQHSYAALKKALGVAEALEDPSSIQVNAAIKAIDDAVAALVDITRYDELTDRYLALKKSDYTDYSFEVLVKAYEAATLVAEHISYLGNDLSAAGMDKAIAAFTAAFDNLVKASDIAAVKNFAQKQPDETLYTPVSLMLYRITVAEATALAYGEPTVAEVAALLAKIETAEASLVKRADKSALSDAIESAKAIDGKSDGLKSALAAAEEIFADANSSQDETDTACENLKQAVAANGKGKRGCGCGSSLGVQSVFAGIALLGIALIVLKRRHKEENL